MQEIRGTKRQKRKVMVTISFQASISDKYLWHHYLSGAKCRLAYGPADATATHCLASVKSRLVLPFWYWLTQAVLEKGH